MPSISFVRLLVTVSSIGLVASCGQTGGMMGTGDRSASASNMMASGGMMNASGGGMMNSSGNGGAMMGMMSQMAKCRERAQALVAPMSELAASMKVAAESEAGKQRAALADARPRLLQLKDEMAACHREMAAAGDMMGMNEACQRALTSMDTSLAEMDAAARSEDSPRMRAALEQTATVLEEASKHMRACADMMQMMGG